ncbi:nitrate/nitrite transporter NrtS [Undibacterium griseum]|uniref:Nitrate/nitrite transporter NrtS n=1 Tax=Undibacterium griseum TaxID=2762295 RepID=A0ABR6YJI4_9BURK|nr:nitrate/nitrite transporter NrtS [Undibacterium griseum]MBC3884066.1 nitrate/nitrite transporter NrtS [Undibacterium griseum]
MKDFLQLACSAGIARSALRVALVVGTALNVINQGGDILVGDNIAWFHLLLNYLVPYCVASYSAARNQIMRSEDE